MTTPKPPKQPSPRRICQGGGGHPAKVGKVTGRILSHSYRGSTAPGSGQAPAPRRNRR